AAFFLRLDSLLPTGGIADAYGRGNSFWIGDWMPLHDRGGAGCLEAAHPRQFVNHAGLMVLTEPLPVRGDVSRVAHRDHKIIRGFSQLIADLERCRFLAFDPIRVDRVDY